jgi:hypothetical protein
MNITKDHKDAILETIQDAQSGMIDEDFEQDLFTMDSVNDNALDIHLVKAMGDIVKNEYRPIRMVDSSWRWEMVSIAQGEYPLEKLPDHVRDLAQVLYYQNVGQKTSKTG